MTVSNAQIERELRTIFSSDGFDLDAETTKTIRSKLCASLGLDKFPPDKKAALKGMIQRLVDEEGDDDDDDREEDGESEEEHDDDDEEEEEEKDEGETETPSPKRKRVSSNKSRKAPKRRKAPPAKSKAPSATTSYNARVKSLLELGTAMRMGPRLYRGLKDMESDSERVQVLTERLQDAGASWRGDVPSRQEIDRAKKERRRLDDLDGIDASLILDGADSRRGRRSRGGAAVSYVEKDDNDDDDEEDDDEKQGDEEEGKEAAEKQRRKQKRKQVESSDDNDDDDDDFGGESSSEEEEFE